MPLEAPNGELPATHLIYIHFINLYPTSMQSEQDNYCLHLSEVNKQRDVVTTQPIYNQQGVLLLAQGANIDERRAHTLLQHKLLKPLEECIQISDILDARQLFDLLNKFAATLPGLFAVTSSDIFQKLLRQMCLYYERFPLLQQNLTVLAIRGRQLYYNGLFSALAGLAIGQRLNLSNRELQQVFIAGLFHDIGFLYLAPQLLTKAQGFSAEEWRALQAHPLIAQRFLKLVPQLPSEIGETIVDHHERLDGTGYPRHLLGTQISRTSQIIAATDNIIFNFHRYKNHGPFAHEMLLTALKVSDNIYFDSVYDAASILFKVASTPENAECPLPSAEELLDKQQQLRIQFDLARELAQQINMLSQDKLVLSINAVMNRLAVSVMRSGVLQNEQGQWLNQLAQESSSESRRLLLELSVMEDQILDQLTHLKNLMERFRESLDREQPEIALLAKHIQNFSLLTMV